MTIHIFHTITLHFIYRFSGAGVLNKFLKNHIMTTSKGSLFLFATSAGALRIYSMFIAKDLNLDKNNSEGLNPAKLSSVSSKVKKTRINNSFLTLHIFI